MPTGYTARIKDDSTLADFALDCAKGFIMHDFSIEQPIPEFEPCDYHRKSLEDAIVALSAAKEWSLDDVAVEIAIRNGANAELRQKMLDEAAEERAKYERMLSMVNEWQPPTPDHIGLKNYMVQQITSTIEADCHDADFAYRCYPHYDGTPEQYREKLIEERTRSVDYHRKAWGEVVERTNQRNAWVKALRESLQETTTV